MGKGTNCKENNEILQELTSIYISKVYNLIVNENDIKIRRGSLGLWQTIVLNLFVVLLSNKPRQG